MDKSRIFDVVNQRIVIGTISAENLVGKYGSPLFVYLASSIRQRINILKDAIKYPRLRWFCPSCQFFAAISSPLRALSLTIR